MPVLARVRALSALSSPLFRDSIAHMMARLSQQQIDAAAQANVWPWITIGCSNALPNVRGKVFVLQGWPDGGTFLDTSGTYTLQFMHDSWRWVLSAKVNGGRSPT